MDKISALAIVKMLDKKGLEYNDVKTEISMKCGCSRCKVVSGRVRQFFSKWLWFICYLIFYFK